MYSKRVLNNIIANIEICFIQMQCDIEAFLKYVNSKKFDLIMNYCTPLDICLF